tara:strand:- start:358 stop:498 length:141 start_codon:yes stop_codon:yes gene_type:complete
MTTLDKIEEIKVILELVSRDNVFLLDKIDKLKQDIVNNLKVTYEKV